MHVKIWDDEITFTVEGRGVFPFDMLRKDMAWPTTIEDATKLGETGRRCVTLTAHAARYVTVRRWESFGWKFHNAELFPYFEAARAEGLMAA